MKISVIVQFIHIIIRTFHISFVDESKGRSAVLDVEKHFEIQFS